VEELKALLLQARQQVSELSATVSEQKQKLVAKEQQILELLKALRGKQRERIDPDQLLLFEIGELEKLIEEQVVRDRVKPSTSDRVKTGH